MSSLSGIVCLLGISKLPINGLLGEAECCVLARLGRLREQSSRGHYITMGASKEQRVNFFVEILNSLRYGMVSWSWRDCANSLMKYKCHEIVPFGLAVPLADYRFCGIIKIIFDRAQVGQIVASSYDHSDGFGTLISNLAEPKGPKLWNIRHRTRCHACSVQKNSLAVPAGRKAASVD
jgi:hypothetical protein